MLKMVFLPELCGREDITQAEHDFLYRRKGILYRSSNFSQKRKRYGGIISVIERKMLDEHKYYESRKAGRDIGYFSAKRDFAEQGYEDKVAPLFLCSINEIKDLGYSGILLMTNPKFHCFFEGKCLEIFEKLYLDSPFAGQMNPPYAYNVDNIAERSIEEIGELPTNKLLELICGL